MWTIAVVLVLVALVVVTVTPLQVSLLWPMLVPSGVA